jgi:ABC-type sugar transport system permease subunit
MDTFLFICIPLLIIFIVVIILIIYFTSKKTLLVSIPNRDVFSFRSLVQQKFISLGFNVKEKKENLIVESGSFTSVGLYFEQNGPQVDVYRFSSSTTVTLVLVIIGAIFSLIIGIIIAIIAEHNSKSFSKDTILPILQGNNLRERRCPNCIRVIPFEAQNCPYCGTQFQSFI